MKNNREKAVTHDRVVRPWGFFEVLVKGPNYWVKRLVVKKGHRLSLQSHRNRNEALFIDKPGIKMEVDGKTVKDLFSVIPKGSLHRISAPRKSGEIIELAWGKCSEDDIHRYEDDYGRIGRPKKTI